MLKAFLCNKRVYQQQCFSKYYYGSMRNNIRKLMIKKNYNYNGTYNNNTNVIMMSNKKLYHTTKIRKKIQTGIVGLPNVGKSSLFNAMTNSTSAEAANFPFCTIDPNIGIANVEDIRLKKLGNMSASEKIIPTYLEFVDIAGLIAGASKGEGLGNKFLSNIKETDAIVHVVRCFDNEEIIHTETTIDPVRDAFIINTELLLHDLQLIENRHTRIKKSKKDVDMNEATAVEKVYNVLNDGRPAIEVANELTSQEYDIVKAFQLLTFKDMIYAANVSEDELGTYEQNKYYQELLKLAKEENRECIPVSAQFESELIVLDENEKHDYLMDLKINDPSKIGLKLLIQHVYKMLRLQTFFTTGKKETRAWTIKKGFSAPKAASVIHSDFEKGFIRAECVHWEDLIKHKSWSNAKDNGLIRSEGKEYVVEEGDVIVFRHNT